MAARDELRAAPVRTEEGRKALKVLHEETKRVERGGAPSMAKAIAAAKAARRSLKTGAAKLGARLEGADRALAEEIDLITRAAKGDAAAQDEVKRRANAAPAGPQPLREQWEMVAARERDSWQRAFVMLGAVLLAGPAGLAVAPLAKKGAGAAKSLAEGFKNVGVLVLAGLALLLLARRR